MRGKHLMLKFLLPTLILMVGFVGMKTLVLSKTPPQKQERPQPGILVETRTVQPEDRTVSVHATGTVQPRMSADIASQVSGRVVTLAPDFIAGGFFERGELLFQIEAADYRLAAERSRAEIAKAEYELAQVESQARVARLEWGRIQLENKAEPNPLVLFEPQLKNARAALAAARADLKQRLLDLRRTKIYAPFNGRIRSETIDPGQYISAGQRVAVMAGTDTAEIVVPVPLEELQWLSVPRNKADRGSPATASIDVGNRVHAWQGRIDRSLGDVDPKGRMARLVVSVDDPYGRLSPSGEVSGDRLDLAEGLFVDITLQGRPIVDVIVVPSGALRDQATVWVMNAEKRLEIREVVVLRREKGAVLIRSGLQAGERMILTRLAGVAQGMQLRRAEEG